MPDATLYEVFKGDEANIAAHIVGHSLLGVSTLIQGVMFFLYSKFARNRPIAIWFGFSNVLLSVYCAARILNLWSADYSFISVLVSAMGFISLLTTVLCYRLITEIERLEDISDLKKKIGILEEKMELLQDIKNGG